MKTDVSFLELNRTNFPESSELSKIGCQDDSIQKLYRMVE
jgi:hypothetical protein